MREISLHILDLLQNSIRAGAETIVLTVLEDSRNDLFSVAVEDDGCGMPEALLSSVTDPFVTTRKERRIGLGISLFAAGCKRCGGNVSIKSAPGKGTRIEGTYRHSHIDRPPLGDIEDTVSLFIMANPQLRFCFTHILDGRGYALDTSEAREILGDVPLDVPEVVSFLKEFIRNNEQEIMEVPKP